MSNNINNSNIYINPDSNTFKSKQNKFTYKNNTINYKSNYNEIKDKKDSPINDLIRNRGQESIDAVFTTGMVKIQNTYQSEGQKVTFFQTNDGRYFYREQDLLSGKIRYFNNYNSLNLNNLAKSIKKSDNINNGGFNITT